MSEDSPVALLTDPSNVVSDDIVPGFELPVADVARNMVVKGSEGGEATRIASLDILNQFEDAGVMLEDKEGIAASLDSLRSEFGIEDSVFENQREAVVLSSVADRLNRVEKTDHLSVGQKTAELEYVADLVMLTVGDHTKHKEEYKASKKEKGVSDKASKAAYDKYTQPEVTKDMDEFIRGPHFDTLRARLGVAQEAPYEVRVLSVDSDESPTYRGIAPSSEYETQMSYAEDLQKNGKAFSKDLGRTSMFAPAWVTTFEDGRKYLCLTLPTAEKVLYKNEERSMHYDESDWSRDLALVEHEYTHTQGSLIKGIGPGIALEELRAEYFSGNRHGYLDIKKYFMGVRMLTGYSPVDSFEQDGKPYDSNTYYTDIAKSIGLDGLLDCLTAIPANYIANEHASKYLKAVVAHNGGGLSPHFQKTYERFKEKLGDGVLKANIDNFIDDMRGRLRNSSLSLESVLYYGNVNSFGKLGTENFRSRYPEESDNYDYEK